MTTRTGPRPSWLERLAHVSGSGAADDDAIARRPARRIPDCAASLATSRRSPATLRERGAVSGAVILLQPLDRGGRSGLTAAASTALVLATPAASSSPPSFVTITKAPPTSAATAARAAATGSSRPARPVVSPRGGQLFQQVFQAPRSQLELGCRAQRVSAGRGGTQLLRAAIHTSPGAAATSPRCGSSSSPST